MGSKNSHSGFEWAVHPVSLLGELDNENDVKKKLQELLEFEEDIPIQKDLLNEVKAAIDTWYKVYHIVVLLVATIHPLQNNRKINRPEPGDKACPSNPRRRCFEKCHVLPAYLNDEGFERSEFSNKYGVIIESRIKGDFVKRRRGIGGSGRGFVKENLNSQRQFNYFFSILKPFLQRFTSDHFLSEGSGWNQQDFLDRCSEAALTLRASDEFPDQYNGYVDRLRYLLENLWGKDAKKNLHTMHSWLNSNGEVGSKEWWIATLNLTSLDDDISELFATGNAAIRKETHKIAAISYINHEIFRFIHKRFEEPNDPETVHGFKGIIDKYSQQNLSEQIWDDILSITSGAIAWQIYRQASLTVKAMTDLTGD